MSPATTPVVVLDVGNVLVEWDLGRLFPDLDEDGRRRFLSEVLTPDVNLRVDRGASLADAVFVDDSPANVAAAAALGFDAFLFTGAASMRRGLRERGLPLAP